jgi:predicted metalloprotease with PDZ domain
MSLGTSKIRLWCRLGSLCIAFLPACAMHAQPASTQPIKISVDATEAAHKILHAKLEMPLPAGPVTLYYPKWMPADHSPDGPIANLVNLQFSCNGKKVPWRRDLEDMFSIHLTVPVGGCPLSVSLDFLLDAPGPTIDFAADASAKLLVLMWNTVLLYPQGQPASAIIFDPELRLPAGWKFNTSLPVSSQSGNAIVFAPVPLDLLIDSPVQSGEFMSAIPLTPGATPPHELDVASDEAWALDVPPELITDYKNLVAEATALYQTHHYRDYHFLFTLSDNVLPLGQEHHESSDDRVSEHALVDTNERLLVAGLLPHEFTHSWNGQYRRPAGLATSDFQKPMQGELLWVYEGLTEYFGTLLTARSGLLEQSQSREHLASVGSMLAHRAGRSWRSIQDTADSAQVLYFSPSQWASTRRSVDFYPEGVFLWLDVDVTIRRLTDGHKSMNDFAHLFYAGPDGLPVISTYTFDDVVSTLNQVVPYDWRSFLRERLDYTGTKAPLDGITGGGWKLVYTDVPNETVAAEEAVSGRGIFISSLGLVVRNDGTIDDVIPGMAAAQGGLCPYMKIMAVGGRQFSMEDLKRAVATSKTNAGAIDIAVSNTGTIEKHAIQYHDGLRGPHLVRVDGTPDYIGAILTPLVKR